MKTYRLLFWVVVGLIILVPSGAVKALTIGGINVTEVISGDGLYKDEYETTCNRYVYRGTDPNNYIEFNGELWRIISKECDGTYKILRNEAYGDNLMVVMSVSALENGMAFDTEGYRDSNSNEAGGTYCANGYSGCNAWAKMDYFSNDYYSGTVLLDSTINIYLNGEYYNSLSPTAQSYVVSHDYNIGAVSGDGTFDTILTEEKAYKWNGYVGLISVTDYLNANSNQATCSSVANNNNNYQTCRSTDWMYIDSTDWWTLSPYSYYYYYGTSYVWVVSSTGTFYAGIARNSLGVRPVVHLTSDLKLSGSGTEEDPYTIVQTNISDIAGETTEDTSVQVVEVPATFMSTFKAVGLGILLVIISGMTIYIIIHNKKINNLPH